MCFCNRLCCEYLQHTCCQTNEDVFLICRYFIIFFCMCFLNLHHVELSQSPYNSPGLNVRSILHILHVTT